MPPESAPIMPQENATPRNPLLPMLLMAGAAAVISLFALFMFMRMSDYSSYSAQNPAVSQEKTGPAQTDSLGADLYTKVQSSGNTKTEAPATSNPINDAYKNPFN